MIEPNQVPIDSESLSALNSNQQYSLLSPLYGNFYSSYEDEFNIDCKFYDEQNLVKSIKEKEADFLIASLNCQSFRAKNNEILSFIDLLNNNGKYTPLAMKRKLSTDKTHRSIKGIYFDQLHLILVNLHKINHISYIFKKD